MEGNDIIRYIYLIMLKKINIAVIGATGYTGLDLINLLSKHPKVNIKNLCATKNLGKKIAYFYNRIKYVTKKN